MSNVKRPGQNTGRSGGIFQEVGPRGGRHDNYATVADNTRLPPTTSAGSGWVPVKTTPTGHR